MPVRTCVGCRRRASTAELVRVYRAADGTIGVGPGDGRGAWLCASPAATACLDDAAQRGALARALRDSVSTAEVDDVRARLEGHRGA